MRPAGSTRSGSTGPIRRGPRSRGRKPMSMLRSPRSTGSRSPLGRLLVAAALALLAAGGAAIAPDRSAEALSGWSGRVDLYRSGAFTTQQSWLWCTAADVQIVRNIVERD